MTSRQTSFNAAFAAWKRGQFAETYRLLASESDPQALHLRGLAARRLGRLAEAEALLIKAASKDNQNAEIHNNQSLVQIDMNNFVRALEHANQALSLRPNWPAAKRNQLRALMGLERWAEAQRLAEQIIALDPSNEVVQFSLATALLELGRARQAWQMFNSIIAGGKQEAAAWFMRGRAAQALGDSEQALIDFRQALTAQPCAMHLRETARLLWTMDREKDFRTLLSTPWKDIDMQTLAAEFLRQSGASYDTVVKAGGGLAPTPEQLATQAWAALDASDAKTAVSLATRAINAEALHVRSVAALITALFMLGRVEDTLELINTMRAHEPDRQHWIAYQHTAWRLLGDERQQSLMDYERFVKVYELPVPDGYVSLTQFNQELERALLELHNHRRHPLDQSLRGGSQTRRDLSGEADPVVQQYLAALDTPIKNYLQHLGTHTSHPTSARNRHSYQFAGCWSVRLDSGGHHVNHVHPQGWISSAYYVSVPESQSNSRAGWIKFGEPPYATQPETPPEYWLEPKVGQLVLFPSFLWHGTHPTTSDQLRLTAPFDLVPGA